MHHLRPRLNHATVVAYLALFVALGGSAFAVSSLPSKSVGTKQLKSGAVTSPKIKNGAVRAAKLANGAVTAAKVKNDSQTGAQIDESTLGTVPDAIHSTNADRATSASHSASADQATSATHSTNADQATNATHSANADQATNADSLGGSSASTYVQGADAITGGDLTNTYASPLIAPDAVTGAKVANDSLTGHDIGLVTSSAAVSFGTINANSCVDAAVPVNGAHLGNLVALGGGSIVVLPANISLTAFVSATDTVTARACNPTTSNISTSAATVSAAVITP
jgi:hypothetical protein